MTDKRITLVTGASRGIGRAVALSLATDHQHHVIALARSKEALEALDDEVKAGGGSATLVPLDLTDRSAIERLSAAILERWGRLDGLVGNAGVLGPISPLQTVTPNSFESTIDVNLTSNWRLIRSFDPLLRMSPSGRAVFVTSGVVPRPRAFWGPYQASKAGLECMVTAWVEELAPTNIKVNLFDPGATATSMRAEAMPGEDQSTLPTATEVGKSLAKLALEEWDQSGERVTFRSS